MSGARTATQREAVRAMLEAGETVTSERARRLHGITHLPGVIHALRAVGCEIEQVWRSARGLRWSEYRLAQVRPAGNYGTSKKGSGSVSEILGYVVEAGDFEKLRAINTRLFDDRALSPGQRRDLANLMFTILARAEPVRE